MRMVEVWEEGSCLQKESVQSLNELYKISGEAEEAAEGWTLIQRRVVTTKRCPCSGLLLAFNVLSFSAQINFKLVWALLELNK